MKQIFSSSFTDAANLLDEFRGNDAQMEILNRIQEQLVQVFSTNGKVMVAGNGGSMADAMHFAEEWTGRFRKDRKPYPVMALADTTHITCVANDFGFAQIFSRPIEAFGQPGDMLFLLSTSGNSENLVLGAEVARKKGVITVGFLGRGGGRLAPLCDFIVMAPGETSDRIQEIHMLSLHILIEATEIRLQENEAVSDGL